MKTIEIDDEVFQALEKRVKGFGETPNDVIERLLSEENTDEAEEERESSHDENGKQPAVFRLIASKEYQWKDAKERYFAVLSLLQKENPAEFEHFNGFRLGSRIQISKSKEDIENSGTSTHPQPLNGSGYWVLSNLSNDRKRAILEIILRDFGFPRDVIAEVLKSIPDSGIVRTKRMILDS